MQMTAVKQNARAIEYIENTNEDILTHMQSISAAILTVSTNPTDLDFDVVDHSCAGLRHPQRLCVQVHLTRNLSIHCRSPVLYLRHTSDQSCRLDAVELHS